jgi:hypothetical protein
VIKKSRSLLFFLYKHECSPSMSAMARHRFLNRDEDCRNGKERGISGLGVIRKVNSASLVWRDRKVNLVKHADVGGVCEKGVGVILRRAPPFVEVIEEPRFRSDSTCSRRVVVVTRCKSSGVSGGEGGITIGLNRDGTKAVGKSGPGTRLPDCREESMQKNRSRP